MTIPRATARLQVHAGFTLDDARMQVDYYATLGISHFYLSPISQARPSSTHGYDVVDHQVVSTDVGGEAALTRLAKSLRERGMGLILDIVPNHMATHPRNAWWWDVLTHGRASAYAEWFDIDWNSPDPSLHGKVLAPFLAQDYWQTLASGDLRLMVNEDTGLPQIDVCGTPYPLDPASLHGAPSDMAHILTSCDPAHAAGRQRLHELLEQQHYRLAWWRCAADSINWRRFFEISELIGVRVEHAPVFAAVHTLPLRLFEQGLIDGVRVDHVDGLAQPLAYCRQLRTELRMRSARRPGALRGDEPWLVVEKILARGEILDERWAVHGTTGYDFMDAVGGLLHDPTGEAALTERWTTLAGDDAQPLQFVLEQARILMLERHFPAERGALLRVLWQLAQSDPSTRDWSESAIGRALDALLIAFPVYRSYIADGARDAHDVDRLATAFEQARKRLAQQRDGNECALLPLLDRWLGGSPVMAPASTRHHDASALQNQAIRRFQQLTPPLMAKALEDTAFYRYGRLLSRNEVGSNPDVFSISSEQFHADNAWRVTHAPQSMLATATHDQKRGEDVRARLAVLSERPGDWIKSCRNWMQWHGSGAPPAGPVQCAERYMLFQTLVGAWPLELDVADRKAAKAFADRIVQWQNKALREAKQNSSWFEPNSGYEEAQARYVYEVLDEGSSIFLDLKQFVDAIAPAAAIKSLASTVLRMTSPGVPDLYQGTEFWDFSLVDPDNRRAVDFTARHRALNASDALPDMRPLLQAWRNGHIKQAVIRRILTALHDLPAVFAQGSYASLPISGPRSDGAIAFLRARDDQAVLVAVPLLCSAGVEAGPTARPMIRRDFWDGTGALLPGDQADLVWTSALTGDTCRAQSNGILRFERLFADLPVAVMVAGVR